MADSVTVEHGGVEITTNTMSEADLRTEMEAPAAEPVNATPLEPPAEGETPAQAAQRARDEKGRFAPKAAAPEPTPEPAAEPEPPARRRDDNLPKHNQHSRMMQALAQKAEAERKAQALEAELLRIQQARPSAEAPAPTNGHAASNGHEPQFEQFANEADPYTAYLQAWTRWDRAQAIAQARAEWEATQEQRSRAQSFQSRLNADKVHYPDFDQVLTQADTLGLQVSAVMQEAIADSPRAADLVYYLATHPEECIQLAERTVQTPVAAATVMQDLLESRLQPSLAAHPAPTVGTGTGARAAVSTRETPRHAGRELACCVRRAAGRCGVCGRTCALLESALEGPRLQVSSPRRAGTP